MTTAVLRAGDANDAATAARLHAANIGEGFLSSLGIPFLTRLYMRVARDPGSALLVAEAGGEVAGFAAVTDDVGALYKRFLVRDGVLAGVRAAPRLVRSWRRVLETLRYPADHTDLPKAEILAVAVAPLGRGHGTGRLLVEGTKAELTRSGVTAARVVTASDNTAALALYQACGFRPAAVVEVHPGRSSTVLTWP